MLKEYSGLVGYRIIELLKFIFFFGHYMRLNVLIFESQYLEKRLTEGFSYENKYIIKANNPLLDLMKYIYINYF